MRRPTQKKLILASSSPRRRELLVKAGVQFEVRVSDIDETPLKQEIPKKMVARLSAQKAAVISKDFPDRWILAADTTVVSPRGKNLGKPVDSKEAMQMLRELQGKTHSVFTAYTVMNGKKKFTRVIETRVTMRRLSAQELKRYVDQGECLDKAGAYAAQGYGMVLIEKISGSYTNVVGLPVAEVLRDLARLINSG
jgi:septum formation protein